MGFGMLGKEDKKEIEKNNDS